MPINRWYNKKEPPKFYRLIITAPDGRFGKEVLEGGIDRKCMEFEAKRYNDMGMVVGIFPCTS